MNSEKSNETKSPPDFLKRKKQLREKEVEAAYGVPVKTLQQWRFKAVGPPYRKVRRCVFYVPEELDAYFAGCTVRPQG